MNRDRAEAYLRLLAEEELRRAAARCSDSPSWSPPEDGSMRPAGLAGQIASGRERDADRAVAGLYSAH